jgi:hypothetical protein
MPSGNDGLSGGAGQEVDRGDGAPGDVAVLMLTVMEEGRGGGGKTTEYDLGRTGGGNNIAMARHVHRF